MLTRRATIAALTGLAFMGRARAQSFPSRPITIAVPYPAGGPVDVTARLIAQSIGSDLGQPLTVDNRGGGAGVIGSVAVARAEPDGHTLLMTSPGIQSINQFLYRTMPFDAEQAFVPISLVADMPMLVVVHPKVGAKTLRELIDIARASACVALWIGIVTGTAAVNCFSCSPSRSRRAPPSRKAS